MGSSTAERRLPGHPAGLDRAATADSRLERDYRSHKRWLLGVGHHTYGLSDQDCEEIAHDTLLAWHRKLLTSEGVKSDRAFCRRVLRDRAADRLRRKTLPIVELSAIESLSVDLELDALVAEREELRDLRELAIELLEPREYEIVQLVAGGMRRADVAERMGLSSRQVKRILERARDKLERGRTLQDELGRCAMVARTIAEIRAGATGPADPRRAGTLAHLARCARCRRSLADPASRPGSLGNDPQVKRTQSRRSGLSEGGHARG
jgi:RNA polymerase sigma factor (sigma-70 family)